MWTTTKLLDFISSEQNTDGSFSSISMPEKLTAIKKYNYTTTFVASTILLSLKDLNDQKAIQIKKKITHFLKKNISKNFSVNYWSNNSQEFTSLPYPDDWDDTATALCALTLNDISWLDGGKKALLTKLLIATEKNAGGPYNTWFTNESEWQDTDLMINSQIAYLLSILDITLEPLNKYIDEIIAKNRIHSQYYPTDAPLYYSLSRWYNGLHKNKLVQKIEAQLKKKKITQPDLILYLIALVHISPSCSAEYTHLYKKLLHSQFDSADAYCYDPMRNKTKYLCCCKALTASLLEELIQLYDGTTTSATPSITGNSVKPTSSLPKKFNDDVLETCLIQLPENTHNAFLSIAKKINDAIPSDFLYIHAYLHDAISKKYQCTLHSQDIVNLGASQLLGWVAYTLYDNIVDHDTDDATIIALSNITLRRMHTCYLTYAKSQLTQKLVDEMLDKADSAMIAEVSIKNAHSIYSHRSIAHTIASCIVFEYSEIDEGAKVMDLYIQFFEHFLIARQLLDDMHDWEDDLQKNRRSYVTALIMKELETPRRDSSFAMIGSKSDISEIRKHFWNHSVHELTVQVEKELAHCHKLTQTMNMFFDTSALGALVDTLAHTIGITTQNANDAKVFLKAFK